MGRMYSISFLQVAVTAQQDFFEVKAGTGNFCSLHSVHVSQESDAGDAEDEQLTLSMVRHDSDATSGSGGTAGTEGAHDPGDAASGAASEVNNTTKVTGGTTAAVKLPSESFNVRAGYLSVSPPLERLKWGNGQILTVELEKTPADSLTMSGTFVFEEEGGDV